MNNKLWGLEQLNGFDNIEISDEHGNMIFYDYADLSVFKLLEVHPDKIIGHKVTSFYSNLTDETSTVMKVIKSGVAICNNEQELITINGNKVLAMNSTYPIFENNKAIGAIEFSKYFYTKGCNHILDNYSPHKIYRKNNTIYTIENIITESQKMIEIKEKIARIAKNDSSVLIYGKTGTGKEIVAQSIHNLSERYNKPFISQNCGAIPSTLLESILFGTVKGSFTGASDVKGLFEQADGGTLFLDEINSLDISLQAKLLKAIEEKNIRRVGGDKNIQLDIRVISATNEPAEKLISERKMREDLFYRLGVVEINLPALSERKEDIKGIVKYYINLYNNNMSIEINDVHPEVLDCFYKYDWPGNVRELKNAIETAYNNATSAQITINDIPERIKRCNSSRGTDITNDTVKCLKNSIEEYEKQIIIDELQKSNHNISEAARRLGISKQLLKYKINKHMLN